MVILAVALPLGAMMPWKRAQFGRLLRPLLPALALALAAAGLAWTLETGRPVLALVAAGLGAWLVAGAGAELWVRAGRTPVRLLRLPRADWGKAAAHSGMGVVIAAVGLLMAGQVEDIRVAHVGQPFTVAGYEITLDKVEDHPGPNFTATEGTMSVRREGRVVDVLHPEKRIYPVQAMPTTEAAIRNGLFSDIYLVLGDPQDDGGWAVRTYIKPFASWLWIGAGLMAFGGALSLSDRRYRVAAGARRAAPAAHPAE